MIFLVGTLGFAAGFILGQILLAYLLRARSKDELLNDKRLQWKYGMLSWLITFATAAAAVWLYQGITQGW